MDEQQVGSRPPGASRVNGAESPNVLPAIVFTPSRGPTGRISVDDVAMFYLRVDHAGAVRWANEPAVMLLRRAGPAPLVADLTTLAHGIGSDDVRTALAATVDGGGAQVVIRLAHPVPDPDQDPDEAGAPQFLHLVLSRDDAAGPGHAPPGTELVVQGWDVSELVHRLRDPLTGLAGRPAFLDRLQRETGGAARSGAVAVLVADVHGLADVADVHGYHAAATVLATIGRRLAAAMRPGDTVARIGDHEFAVICTRLTGPHEAMAVADRVRATATEPLEIAGRPRLVPLTVGVAFTPGDAAVQAAALLREALRRRP